MEKDLQRDGLFRVRSDASLQYEDVEKFLRCMVGFRRSC